MKTSVSSLRLCSHVIGTFSGTLLVKKCASFRLCQKTSFKTMKSSASKTVDNGLSVGSNVKNTSPAKLQFDAIPRRDSSPYFADFQQSSNGSLSDVYDGTIKNGAPDNATDEIFNVNFEESPFEGKFGKPRFQPKKILVLTKLTRLEYERRTNPEMSDDELSNALKERGSDYGQLLIKYRSHTTYLNTIIDEIKKHNIEHRLVQRWDYTEENIQWADAIFTAGGDGTFLLAASKINKCNKPVIGINTDPSGSEGYMCLLKKSPESKFSEAFKKLLRGEFKWLWRQRIRVTLSGWHAFEDPIELHDQQLMFPEYRWSEHVREFEDARNRLRGNFMGAGPARLPSSSTTANAALTDGRHFSSTSSQSPPYVRRGPTSNERVLPYLALNEVFIGESLSSRVSYYELQVDNGQPIKQKSSGFTVCTGTGSTSWYFNINKLTEKCVSDLLTIINDDLGVDLPSNDPAVIGRLCRRFNDQLIFSPADLRMAFTVRDPVFNATYKQSAPRGFARKVVVKSRCCDAHLVIDGGLSYIFNDGAQVTLEMRPEDALRTVIFR